MSLYRTKFNPFTKKLQWILNGTLIAFKEGVDTYNSLPITNNTRNEARIANDTGHLYVWSIEASSGDISNWVDQGDIIDIDWNSIENKPSSTPANIDDAVDKKHEQNTDTKLAEGNINEVTASEIVKNISNTILLAFDIAVLASITIYEMIDGFVDLYLDESGIDTDASIDEYYDSRNDLYTPRIVIPGIDENTKLMLHCNGIDGSDIFIDSSLNPHTVTANGTAQLDTAERKWGTASGLFDGDSDYLTVPDSTDWDVFATTTESWTIDFWVKLNTYDTHIPFIMQRVDSSNLWQIRHSPTYGIELWLRSGGTTRIGNYAVTGRIQDNNWHHVCFAKVGAYYGLYLDGVQCLYINDSNIANFTSLLNIGNEGSIYLDGHMDEIKIEKSNCFGASPNVGKTDTITVPLGEYGESGIVYDMTLISESQPADIEPTKARIVISEEDVDEITLNTDIKAYISRDDGSTWAEAIWAIEKVYGSTERIFVGHADLSVSGIGSGTDMRYKIETLNEKRLKIRSTSLLWD